MLNTFIKSILGGFMIGIGACALLSAKVPVVGSVFFAFGLITILMFNLKLYTGAIGYYNIRNTVEMGIIFLGNLVGTFALGTCVKYSHLRLPEAADTIVQSKVPLIMNLPLFDILFAGFMCGVLMYIGVAAWKDNLVNPISDIGKCIMVMLAVSIFILSGFEHVIADMVYLFMAGNNTLPIANQALFISLVGLGNSLGSICFHRIRVTQF